MKLAGLIIGICCIKILVCAQTPGQKDRDTSSASTDNMPTYGKVTFGIKAGYTHSNLYGNEINYMFADPYTNWMPGFHLGIFVNSHWGKYFILKHELFVSQRGALVALNDSVNGRYKSKLNLWYLDVYPVNLTGNLYGFQIFLGPYVGMLLDAGIERINETGTRYEDKSIFGEPGNNESKKKYLQKFDYGIALGIEYQFPFGLLICAKYARGFADIFQFANSYTFNDPKIDDIRIYNHSLTLSLGYAFVRAGKTQNTRKEFE